MRGRLLPDATLSASCSGGGGARTWDEKKSARFLSKARLKRVRSRLVWVLPIRGARVPRAIVGQTRVANKGAPSAGAAACLASLKRVDVVQERAGLVRLTVAATPGLRAEASYSCEVPPRRSFCPRPHWPAPALPRDPRRHSTALEVAHVSVQFIERAPVGAICERAHARLACHPRALQARITVAIVAINRRCAVPMISFTVGTASVSGVGCNQRLGAARKSIACLTQLDPSGDRLTRCSRKVLILEPLSDARSSKMAEKAKALALGAVWQYRAVLRHILRRYRAGSSRMREQPAIHGIEPHLVVSSLRGRRGLVPAPIRKVAVLAASGPEPPFAQ
eukprot:scaffold13971_cov69-Phaeocystis_antarctica.AAC.6